jgi:hypothetical protein
VGLTHQLIKSLPTINTGADRQRAFLKTVVLLKLDSTAIKEDLEENLIVSYWEAEGIRGRENEGYLFLLANTLSICTS